MITSQGQVLDIMREALMIAMKLAGPMLIVSIAVGLIVSIFQAATQIHEQTLTFVPKVIIISLMLLMAGDWMIGVMKDFIAWLFSLMARL